MVEGCGVGFRVFRLVITSKSCIYRWPSVKTASFTSSYRSVPVTTISISRLLHLEQTTRSRQSGTGVSAPCRAATSARFNDGSPWHHTISRTRAAAAAPSAIGGPDRDFILGTVAPWRFQFTSDLCSQFRVARPHKFPKFCVRKPDVPIIIRRNAQKS